jgi:hypothetical protein
VLAVVLALWRLQSQTKKAAAFVISRHEPTAPSQQLATAVRVSLNARRSARPPPSRSAHQIGKLTHEGDVQTIGGRSKPHSEHDRGFGTLCCAEAPP